MKKTAYLAPATNIEMIQIQSLLNSVSNVGGDSGVQKAGDDEEVPGTAESRRNNVWDDEE